MAVTAVSTTGRARSRQVSRIAVVGGAALAPQSVVGVDQHDVVVHDDAGIGDDADARHHHAERLAHHHQPDQHADGREHHGGEHQKHAGELVELREQDGEDQEDRRAERLHQEGAGRLALLVLALHLVGDALAEVGALASSVEHLPAARRPTARPRPTLAVTVTTREPSTRLIRPTFGGRACG